MDKKVKTDELTTPVKPFNIKTASSPALLQETNFPIRFCQCLVSAGVQIQTCFPHVTPISHHPHNTALFLDLSSNMWGMAPDVSRGPWWGPVAALLLLLLITMCGYYPSGLQQAGKYKLYDLTPCKPDNIRVVHLWIGCTKYWHQQNTLITFQKLDLSMASWFVYTHRIFRPKSILWIKFFCGFLIHVQQHFF